jgi:predicted NBD/HSP70 family sugar kinase
MAIPPLLKDLNERTVLETIRSQSPISRAEISRRAGISKPTVSLALDTLLAAGLVQETAPAPGRPTYGARFFEDVPEAAVVLGLDLGARFLRAALADLRGTVRARHDVELRAADADLVLESLPGLVNRLVEAAGYAHVPIEGAVLGLPGAVDGPAVHLVENVVGLDGRRFAEEVGERLGISVAAYNDINLAAVGEHRRGAARGVDDFAFVSVGTGLGAGLVLGGTLHVGHHGAAGELDFVSAGRADEIDPSAAALSALAERTAAGRQTSLAPPFAGPDIFAAAATGDAVAQEVVAEEARRIALHVAPVAAVADVGLVVLGGGIGANLQLLSEIRRLLAEWLPFPPRVEVSSLGDAAVLSGALAVALDDALDAVFATRRSAAAGRA